MNLKKQHRQVMMTTKMATFIMVILLLFTISVSHGVTQGGVYSTVKDFRLLNILLASLSVIMVGIYGYYHKIYYLICLMVGLVLFATIDYQNSPFIIDGKIESLFLGFYLILTSSTVFMMIAPWTDLRRKNLDKHIYIIISLTLMGSYALLKRFILLT